MTEIIQPNEEIRIQDGSKVDLHFSVSIENGVEIDNTRNREEPVSLVIGDGNLLPGFEKALFGLRAGDRRTVHLPPEDAFGPWNAENIQIFDTVKFEPSVVLNKTSWFSRLQQLGFFWRVNWLPLPSLPLTPL